jgi:uncharacterized membrane protein
VRFAILLQALNLWIHILSLSVWIGGMLFFLLVFAPAVRSLQPGPSIAVLNLGRRYFQAASWIAINLLFITGMINLIFRGTSSEFAPGSGYYLVLGIKLLLYLTMVLHHCFQAFKYAPRITSLSAQTSRDTSTWPEDLLSLWKKWFVLLKINATL